MTDHTAGWLVRFLRWLLSVLEHPSRDADDTAADAFPDDVPTDVPAAPAPPARAPYAESRRRPRSPYAAMAAAEAEADRVGAVRRWPPPSPRPYAPARWHIEEDRFARQSPPTAPASAAQRFTQGRRRAELWLATVGIDAGPRVIHGVPVGAGTGVLARSGR